MFVPAPHRNYAFVKVDDPAALNRTASGLYLPPPWSPGDRQAQRAVVVQLPQGLASDRLLEYPGMDGHTYHYDDIAELPEVGDVVYLRPNTFKPHMEYSRLLAGGEGIFLVELEAIVAFRTKGGALLPFQGFLLGDHVYDSDVVQLPNGAYERQDPTGLVTELWPEPKPFQLRITHMGRPLRGQESVVTWGDVVVGHHTMFALQPYGPDDPDADGPPVKYVHLAPRITIEGRDHAYLPRQMVMSIVKPGLVFGKPLKKRVHYNQHGDGIEYISPQDFEREVLNQPIVFQPTSDKTYDITTRDGVSYTGNVDEWSQLQQWRQRQEQEADFRPCIYRMGHTSTSGRWLFYPHFLPLFHPVYDA